MTGSVQHRFHCSACSRNETLSVNWCPFIYYVIRLFLFTSAEGLNLNADGLNLFAVAIFLFAVALNLNEERINLTAVKRKLVASATSLFAEQTFLSAVKIYLFAVIIFLNEVYTFLFAVRLFLALLNSIPLICAYSGLVAPNTDFTYFFTSAATSTIPVSLQ